MAVSEQKKEPRAKHSLADLNEYLFDALDAVTNDSLEGEDLENEIERAKTVSDISMTIIKNAEVQVKGLKTLREMGYASGEQQSAGVAGLLGAAE